MNSVERLPQVNNDSEMEEGEIVDEWDDLSDISSEEEFLLRQRLLVLENYNNVLERKEAKRVSLGIIEKHTKTFLPDLSEISATELEDNTDCTKHSKIHICSKASHRQKKINLHSGHRKNKKKYHRKRKLEPKIVSESSEESDDEYRNKRRKLANAVVLNKAKVDTSLKARLEKMFGKKTKESNLNIETVEVCNKIIDKEVKTSLESIREQPSLNKTEEKEILLCNQLNNIEIVNVTVDDSQRQKQDENCTQSINDGKDECDSKMHSLCTEEDEKVSGENINLDNVVELSGKEIPSNKQDSDDELELLRQYALKTKSIKTKSQSNTSKEAQNKPQSEDDESDTADLRLICLKSALLKRAIEMKMKQKLRKRLKSKSLQNDIVPFKAEMGNATDLENNTDIESVDMDIGSDGDDKTKESSLNVDSNIISGQNIDGVNKQSNGNKQDELDDDEDLLRAQLLTSLTRNLPNLIAMDDVVNSLENTKIESTITVKSENNKNVPEEKKFIINLKDTDSEGEHEATKNLTKMHMKLSERLDFQEKLDLFLKSTRLQVESNKLPDVVQQPAVPKPQTKYVPKAVNHLPKSEQIEYKNLVKRMAELEKMKQIRQASMNQKNANILKETVNPRNVTVQAKNTFSNNIDEKIAVSRKNIAEESARMLKLKEEATKLLQKYKIVATELHNISTAITMNKKEQRTVQSKLARIRTNHQMLIKSSNFKHSTGRIASTQIRNKIVVNKLQKENNPTKEEHKSTTQNTIKTGTVNNSLNKEITGPISKQVDTAKNQTDRIPKVLDKEKSVIVEDKLDIIKNKDVKLSHTRCDNKDSEIHPVLEANIEHLNIDNPSDHLHKDKERNNDVNEYESPLNALGSTIWQEDPNAFLCPYEVGGSCRDPDCKFLHPKIPSNQ